MAARTVRVRYLGLVRNVLGVVEEGVELPEGARVRELVDALSERHGEAFTDVVLRADGRLRPAVHLFIEGQDDESLGLDAQLPGDYVVMMVEVFPIQGG